MVENRSALKRPFKVKTIEACTTPGVYCDGGNLYLQIKAGSTGDVTRSWTFRYRSRITGKPREMGLGPYPDVSLAEAREKAYELRGMLRNLQDPIDAKRAQLAALRTQAAKTITFDEAAAQCIAGRKAGWKNDAQGKQWESTLATYASPILGKVPVQAIDTAHVMKVIEPIWESKTTTANEVRRRIEIILNWASARKFRQGENPARWRGHLDQLLPKPAKVAKVEHHAALPYRRMFELTAALHQRPSVTASALEFTVLTACRTGEVIGAKWEEFNLDDALWTIPAARMKAGVEHTVPLSPRALELIRQLEQVRTSDYVFPTNRKEGETYGPISNMAMTLLMRRLGYGDFTVHGFRSAFRDWAGDNDAHFERQTIEHALAHRIPDKAEAAYARSTQLEKRRSLMAAWARHCATMPKVTGTVQKLKLG